MDACNNGHFWMFHVDHVDCTERMNASGKGDRVVAGREYWCLVMEVSQFFKPVKNIGTKTLLWANLGRPDNDVEKVEGYEGMCR